MTTAYFDCFSGISGNMVLGALLDTGLKKELLLKELKKMKLNGYSLKTKKVKSGSLNSTYVDIKITKPQKKYKNFFDIKKIIDKSSLSSCIKEKSISIFKCLASAESKVHGTSLKNTYFHEVGALDNIIDVVGSVICLDLLGIDKVLSSPINIGKGLIKGSHGILPVPTPATAEILKNKPVFTNEINTELATPTGAAIVTTLAKDFCSLPPFNIEKIGYGAGGRKTRHPNLSRVLIGKETELGVTACVAARDKSGRHPDKDTSIIVLETNIDDMSPEIYDYLFDRLLDNGALDVYLENIIMKKCRPAQKLTVLLIPSDLCKIADIILKETTTFGIRYYKADRITLYRKVKVKKTKFGKIRIKQGYLNGKLIKEKPEYEDCVRIAKKKKKNLKDILK